MKISARLAAPSLAALALVALALPPSASPASAKQAPTLTVTAGDPNTPIRVPLPTEDPATDTIHVTVGVASGPATNVTVSLIGTGLTGSAPQNLGAVNGTKAASVSVGATTGGFHQLTIIVTADGATPAQTTLNYVWAPTGAMTVSPTQDFQYTYFGTTGLYSENGTSFEDRAELLFLTQDIAYYGAPAAGRPKCKTGSTTATSGCLAYAYNLDTHLIQIGGAIGYADKTGVHTQGLGLADFQDDELYANRDWTQQLQLPNTHNRYSGTWKWVYTNYCPDCFTFAALTLHKDGTFKLLDNFKGKRTIHGKYDISHFGRLTLTGKFGKTGKELHTFAIFLNKKGKPNPRLGIALGFGKGKNTDVAFLKPKKG